MNILRLVVEEKERKKRAAVNPNFAKLQDEAASKDKGVCPIHFPKEELIVTLSAEQFLVTQQGKTERCDYLLDLLLFLSPRLGSIIYWNDFNFLEYLSYYYYLLNSITVHLK